MDRFRGSFKHVLKIAKKKERLRKILDKLDNISVEELEKIGQPKWIRKQLISEKQRRAKKANGHLTPEEIADRMNEYSKSRGKM